MTIEDVKDHLFTNLKMTHMNVETIRNDCVN